MDSGRVDGGRVDRGRVNIVRMDGGWVDRERVYRGRTDRWRVDRGRSCNESFHLSHTHYSSQRVMEPVTCHLASVTCSAPFA